MEEHNLEQQFQQYFGIPLTIMGSTDWKELENRENLIGPEALLDEIINKRLWNNTEIAWVIRRMVYYYGRKDALLKKVPIERLFLNILDVLRVFFLLLDHSDPDIEENMRLYISSKLTDATWGINSRTREYLHKL